MMKRLPLKRNDAMNEEEKKELEGFNPGQLQAIQSDIKENILISAGAGSGKTKTLSYKVYHLVAYEGVDPSQLLVLTFTNKAAFEMKERIIAQFKSHNSPLKDRMVSSHIQTFDSFSMYLVKKYASALKMPSNVMLADDSILNEKKNEILDEVLHEYYEKDEDRIYQTLSKFCCSDDSYVKKLVFYIDNELSKLLPEKRKRFVESYDDNFLSRKHFDASYEKLASIYKELLKQKLAICLYDVRCHGLSLDSQLHQMYDPDNFRVDYDCTNYLQADICQKFYIACLDLLKCPDIDFFDQLHELLYGQEHDYLFNPWQTVYSSIFKDTNDKESADKTCFYVPMKEFLFDVYGKLKSYGYDKDKQYEVVLSFKDDIHLLFEIIQKMNDRLDEYKLQTNSYTFADIGYKALSLLVDPRYEDVAAEIKNRFCYVLVDEYQDTNDVQESFLNAISENATLFCVGDAKQSIYRFRNSNVQLFMDRMKRYEEKPSLGRTISMNLNYRSEFKLLDDINAIFDRYMTFNHGGIEFAEPFVVNGKNTYPQRLDHVDHLNRGSDENNHYGIELLQFSNDDHKKDLLYEMYSIILDIKNKVTNGYQVIEGKSTRPCRYSDFAILTRNKNSFSEYQDVFREASIPLNVVTSDFLTQINAILLLQSLINLISCRMDKINGEDVTDNQKQLFVSVARSYIYGTRKGYDDKHIYEILMDKDHNVLECDPIIRKIDSFVFAHKTSPLGVIFLDILDEFEILSSLSYVGDVNSNVNKIESFYRIVVAQEGLGQGLKDFVKLFGNLSKYRIDIESETDSEVENAVNLMTIHKSKGLEFPIVYMPLHDNSLGMMIQSKTAYNLSLNHGLILPYFQYDETTPNFLNAVYYADEGSVREEVNEHVRIFYVALTRAKENLIIVGNEEEGMTMKKKKETLYDMLSSLYSYPRIREEYVQLFLENGFMSTEDYGQYQNLLQDYRKLFNFPINEVPSEVQSYCQEALKEKTHEKLDEIDVQIKTIKNNIMLKMLGLAVAFDSDQKARFVSISWYMDYTIKDSATLLEKHPSMKKFEKAFDDRIVEINKNLLDKKPKANPYDELEFKALLEILYGYHENFFVKTYDESVVNTRQIRFDQMTSQEIVNDEEQKAETKPLPLIKLDLKVDDSKIEFRPKMKKEARASKQLLEDEDLDIFKALEFGTKLHAYLEVADFKTKDTSFIQDEKERKIITNVLNLDLFKDIEHAKVFKEYAYYDSSAQTTGSIDCLLVYEDRLVIIDYKTKEIDDPDYDRQLNVYRRNMEGIFPGKKVEMWLLSIETGQTRAVERMEV